MTDSQRLQPADDTEVHRLLPWERWTTDHNGEQIIEWDTAAHAEWREKWAPPCPDGNPQRLRRPLGFWERNVGQLELRLALGTGEGACQLIVDERDDHVFVRVLVCYHEEDERAHRPREYVDCPVRVWLESPLGTRAVVDVDSDEELPLFTPLYLDNKLQPDHGYKPAGRRRAAGEPST
jgi:hypothetical protein